MAVTNPLNEETGHDQKFDIFRITTDPVEEKWRICHDCEGAQWSLCDTCCESALDERGTFKVTRLIGNT